MKRFNTNNEPETQHKKARTADPNKLTLVTPDGEEFCLDRNIAERSPTLKNLIEDIGDDLSNAQPSVPATSLIFSIIEAYLQSLEIESIRNTISTLDNKTTNQLIESAAFFDLPAIINACKEHLLKLQYPNELPQHLTLISNEGTSITVPLPVAQYSELLADIIETFNDHPYKLHNPISVDISAKALNFLVEVLSIIEAHPPQESALKANELLTNKITGLSFNDLREFTIAADFFLLNHERCNIQPLLKAVIKRICNEGVELFHSIPFLNVNLSHDCIQYVPKVEAITTKIAQMKCKTLPNYTAWINGICFSPNGTILAFCVDKTIELWDVKTGNSITFLHGHSSPVSSVCVSPDGMILASGSHDKTIKLWDIKSGNCIKTLKGHISTIFSLCFSPDGTTLASSSSDTTIKLWEIESGNCINTLCGHKSAVYSVRFSPDGKTLASGSQDNTIKFWYVTGVLAGKCKKTLLANIGSVLAVCFSPDGKILASGSSNNTIKLWDVTTGNCAMTLQGHRDYVYSVCFSSEGEIIASGSGDNTSKLWAVKTGQCITTFHEHNRRVSSVCFSPNSITLASGSDDKTIKVLNLNLITILDDFLNHEITLEQLLLIQKIFKRESAEYMQILVEQNNVEAAIFKSLPKALQQALIDKFNSNG